MRRGRRKNRSTETPEQGEPRRRRYGPPPTTKTLSIDLVTGRVSTGTETHTWEEGDEIQRRFRQKTDVIDRLKANYKKGNAIKYQRGVSGAFGVQSGTRGDKDYCEVGFTASIDHYLQLKQFLQSIGIKVYSTKPQIVGSEPSRYTSDNMGDLAAYYAVARKAYDKGLSVAELDEATEDKLAAKASAREITARAKTPPRPDWVEARARGVTLPDFIAEKFEVELREGTMTRAMLKRYDKLPADFYGYPRHHKMPDWLEAIPTKEDWLREHPAQKPVRTDEVRRYEREDRRARRHQKQPAL
jgi:hypothetical protein